MEQPQLSQPLILTGSQVLFNRTESDKDFIFVGRFTEQDKEILTNHNFWEHESYLPWVPRKWKLWRHYTEEIQEDLNWEDKHKYEHDMDIFEMHPVYYKEYQKHFNSLKEALSDQEQVSHSATMDWNNRRSYLKEKSNYTQYINKRMIQFITNSFADTLDSNNLEEWLNEKVH